MGEDELSDSSIQNKCNQVMKNQNIRALFFACYTSSQPADTKKLCVLLSAKKITLDQRFRYEKQTNGSHWEIDGIKVQITSLAWGGYRAGSA